MLRNYLIVAIRNLLRYKIHSFINIVGLAIGMACCVPILLFIQNELSYDRHHENADRIYRIMKETDGASPKFSPYTCGALAPTLLTDFPEVKKAVRISSWGGTRVRYKDKNFGQRFCIADPSILQVFTFSFIKGDPQTALREPFSIVLTKEVAQKYFGDEDPMGKVVTVSDRYFTSNYIGQKYFGGYYKVTGILENMPANSNFTLRFDFLTSSQTISSVWDEWTPEPVFLNLQTFVLLPKGYSHTEFERKLPVFTDTGEDTSPRIAYHLQPLTRIYLYSGIDYGIGMYGSIVDIYQLSLIAFFILLIACVNFTNLATAQSARRAREVGMRKVVGAHRLQLIQQFLSESILLSFLSLLFAVVLIELFLPYFNAFTGKRLSLDLGDYGSMLIGLVGISLSVGILAGSYPAFFLSAFRPVEVLKGALMVGVKKAPFRKGLVVFQFSISIFLIIGTLIVVRQQEYSRNKDLGFDKEQMVVLRLFGRDPSLIRKYDAIKKEFLQHPNVLKAASSHSPPGRGAQRLMVQPEGILGDAWKMLSLAVDEDFFETYGIKLLAGRNFSKDLAGDSMSALILNETAVKQLGWKKPIGKQFRWEGGKGQVIGVVKDFHLQSLYQEIGPAVFCMWPHEFNYLSLKFRTQDVATTLDFLEEKWKGFRPHDPFRFSFLNEIHDQMYQKTTRFKTIFGISSLVAILLSCMGLFGLASFTIEQHTKEIGIRKVLGASVSSITLLLSRDFVKLVIASNLIAWSAAY
ncbi:MAG: ABC transporter permease, partial [Candidatus Latescibacteria bacterium]|nr:ABC transporter permease [Candidatus Latescibacterota bacterium]